MKNKKSLFQIIYLGLTLLPLIYIFIKTRNVIFLIFIIIGSYHIIKKLCLYYQLYDYARLLTRLYQSLFFIFWFSFLTILCIYTFKSKQYGWIIFSIPFWMGGIGGLMKTFFPTYLSNWKLPFSFNIKVVISFILVAIVLIAGGYMVVRGFQENNTLQRMTQGYETTQGYFVNYDLYQVDKDGQETYCWYYEYEVDGQVYHVKTDYGSSSIPEYGSQRDVKYNPLHPEQSVLVGTNSSMMMIMIGSFFLLVGTTFVFIGCQSLGYFDRFHFDIIGCYIGFVFLVVGIGVFSFQTGMTSVLEGIKMMGLWSIIPILFIAVGVWQLIKCLKNHHKE